MTAPTRLCAGQGDLMQDPAREDIARYVCFGCPQMYPCREWAVRTDVTGVVGGLTDADREQWRRYAGHRLRQGETHLPLTVLVADDRWRRGRDPELTAGVLRMGREHSASELADLIGTTERQICRIHEEARAATTHPRQKQEAS